MDANAKLMALSGKKGIEIKGVKDEEHQRTENKSAGGECRCLWLEPMVIVTDLV